MKNPDATPAEIIGTHAVRCPYCTQPVTVAAGFSVDVDMRVALVNGAPVKLRPTEARLARLFFDKLGVPLHRDRIAQAVWGSLKEWPSDNAMDMHVSALRRKLAAAPFKIQSVASFGFVAAPIPADQEQ